MDAVAGMSPLAWGCVLVMSYGATLAWQTYGNEAKQIVAILVPVIKTFLAETDAALAELQACRLRALVLAIGCAKKEQPATESVSSDAIGSSSTSSAPGPR